MTHPFTTVDHVTVRHVHLKLEQETWERARQAAAADRRSLVNWLTVLVERTLEEAHPEAAEPPAS